MRKVAIVRAVALLIGSASIAVSVLWAVSSYDKTEARLHASLCSGGVPTPAADANGCVATEIDVVTGLSTSEDSDGDTTYEMDYQRASGVLEDRQDVTESLYNAVTTGSALDVETWQGNVIAILADSDESIGTSVTPPGDVPLLFAGMGIWAGLSMILWFLLGDGKLRHLSVPHLAMWAVAGGSFVGAFYISVVGPLIWAEVVLVCLGLFSMFFSVYDLPQYDDRGEESLGDRAWAYWSQRIVSRYIGR